MINDLEHDTQADIDAHNALELENIEEVIWDNFDWKTYGAEINEAVVQNKYHDEAMVKFMRGDYALLIAICTEAQEVVVKRLAKEQQKAGQL